MHVSFRNRLTFFFILLVILPVLAVAVVGIMIVRSNENSNTNELIFDVPAIIAWVTAFMTLLPGDVLLTGTPEGVGKLADGDVVEVEVEGVGVLRNEVRG